MTELYDGNTPPATPEIVAPAPITLSKLPDNAASLIGEGKKYATVEAALAALAPAQEHIAKIEADNAALRAKGETGKTVEEVYAAVVERLEQEGRQPPAAALDTAMVASLVKQQVVEITETQKQDANETAFRETMKAKFGDKDGETFNTRADELGMSRKALSDLVRTSPAAAYRLLGLEAPKATPRKTVGSISTEALAQQHQPPVERKQVMFGGTSQDLLNEWRRHAPKQD